MPKPKLQGKVYLIHFHRKLHHASHYLGFATDLEERVERHRKGDGARLIEVINGLGIGWDVSRTWDGDRSLERKLKRLKKATRLCPTCQQKIACIIMKGKDSHEVPTHPPQQDDHPERDDDRRSGGHAGEHGGSPPRDGGSWGDDVPF